MTHANAPVDLPGLVRTLMTYRLRWMIPTVLLTVLAVGYALVRSATWEATQSLLVRDEATANETRLGRFDDPQLMKTAQETVVELARSRSVVTAALTQVGPPATLLGNSADWPSEKVVEHMRGAIRVVAPNGAEFGQTEVFHIKVQDPSKTRAIALAAALCQQLDTRLQQVRDHRAMSLVNELTKTVAMAQADLDASTRNLVCVEREVGPDLSELRIMNESDTGESNLRHSLIEINQELRQVRAQQIAGEQLMLMLEAAKDDPNQLVATPNQLLESQIAVRQLKDGLVAAKLQAAQLLGELTSTHPRVRAVVASQTEIELHLHRELNAAIAGVIAEQRLSQARIAELDRQASTISQRMNRLAEVRAEYGNLLADVRRRSEILSDAQKQLADARASHSAAHAASLLTFLDGPGVGDSPVGLSRKMIVLCGLCGGLISGLGIVFLTVPGIVPNHSLHPHTVTRATNPAPTSHDPLVGGVLSLKQALMRLTPSWT